MVTMGDVVCLIFNICMFNRMNTIYIYIYIYIYANRHTQKYKWCVCVCVYVCMYVCIYIYVCMYVYMYIYIYLCKQTRTKITCCTCTIHMGDPYLEPHLHHPHYEPLPLRAGSGTTPVLPSLLTPSLPPMFPSPTKSTATWSEQNTGQSIQKSTAPNISSQCCVALHSSQLQ